MADAAPVAPAAPAPVAEGGDAPAEGGASEAPVKAAPLKPAPKSEPELYEVKAYGKTERLTVEQLKLRAQKEVAVEVRMQKLAEKEKHLAEIEALLETDPDEALRRLKKDPDKIYEKAIARKAELAQMTPEQREVAELKRERDEMKKRLDGVAEKEKTAAQQAADQRTAQRLEETLLTAAESFGVEKSPEALEGLCDIALEAIEMKIPITAEQVVQEFVYREQTGFLDRVKKRLPAMPTEKLLELLGPEALEKARKASLKEMPKPGQVAKPKAPTQKPPSKGYLTEAELERELGLRK